MSSDVPLPLPPSGGVAGGASSPSPSPSPPATSSVNASQISVGGGATAAAAAREPTGWFLKMLKMLNIITASICVLSIIALLVAWDTNSTAESVLRLYGSGLMLMSALAETESLAFLSRFPLFESWLVRGGILLGTGTLLLHFFDMDNVKNATTTSQTSSSSSIFSQSIMGWALIVVGSTYAFGAIACIKRVRDHHLNRLRKRDAMRREKLALESRKHEIEKLLGEAENKLERMEQGE